MGARLDEGLLLRLKLERVIPIYEALQEGLTLKHVEEDLYHISLQTLLAIMLEG